MKKPVLLLGTPWGKQFVSAFLDSIRGDGYEVIDCRMYKDIPTIDAEFAVCWGLRPPHEGWIKSLPFPTVVLDSGYFLRAGVGNVSQQHDDEYVSVGINGILQLPPHSVEGSKRLTELMTKFPARMPSFQFRPTVTRRALIVGQVPEDRSHGLTADQLIAFYSGMSTVLAERYEVVFRPHPGWVFQLPNSLLVGSEDTFGECCRRLRPAVIATYCSTAGFLAACDGFNVISHPRAFYHGGSIRLIAERCAASQFNESELRNGTALAYAKHRMAYPFSPHVVKTLAN